MLQGSRPISFHKFWQIDPYNMYEYWLNREASATKLPNRSKEYQQIIKNHDNQKYLIKTMCHSNKCDDNENQLKIKQENDVIKVLNPFSHKEL